MDKFENGMTDSVLLVLPWGPENQGGVTGVVTQLIRHWPEGHPVRPRLVVSDWNYVHPETVGSASYLRFDVVGKLSPMGLLKALIRAPLTLYRIQRFLDQSRARAVNFHYPHLLPLGIAILKRLGFYKGSLVVSYHGTDVFPARSGLEARLRKFVLDSADAIVACSNGLAQRLAATFQLPPDRVSVVYNGVNASLFRPDSPAVGRVATGVPSDFIISVGAFIPRKSQKTLLEAFAGDLKDRFPGLHLCLAGADGSDLPMLEDMAETLGIRDRVHFYVNMNQQEVAYLLARSRACVQTALAESFPLAILEAGAAGAPIVASRISGHDEVVFDGETGGMFAPGNAEDCAKAVAACLLETDKAREMAVSLRQRVLNNLTWDECVSRYLAAYLGQGR